MLSIFLISTNKRKNSTLQPTGGVKYSVSLKDGCSIDTPTFILNATNINGYNYCYCENWQKYYWITSRTYDKGMWFISCTCDLLATYKAAILDTSALVIRSSSFCDPYIPDMLMPINKAVNNSERNVKMELTQEGSIIAGFIGNGTTSYYVFTPSGFNNLMDKIYTKECFDTNNSALGITSDLYYKLFINASQYVMSATWIPAIVVGATKAIKLGAYDTGITAGAVSAGTIWERTYNVQIPTNPLISDKRQYLNYEPFAYYNILLPYIGTIPIPSSDLQDASTLTVKYSCDVSGNLQVNVGTDVGIYIATLNGSFGVPVAFGGASSTPGSSIIGAAGGVVASILTGNPLGIAGSIISGIEGALPTVSCSGGSCGAVCGDPYIRFHARFAVQGDVDNDKYGRPYGVTTKLTKFTGYVKTIDASVSCYATEAQTAEINNQLDSGIYIE